MNTKIISGPPTSKPPPEGHGNVSVKFPLAFTVAVANSGLLTVYDPPGKGSTSKALTTAP